MLIAIIVVLVILILYLFAVRPSTKNFDKAHTLSDWFYAHRGLHDNNVEVSENSLAAFSLAMQSGFGMELDVQLTADGVAVVFHDESVERTCGINRKISEMTLEEVKELNLFNTNDKIPQFSELLNLIDGKVPLVIELKPYNNPQELCVTVDKLLSDYKGLYCIESFNPQVLIWYKKNRPDTVRGQLSCSFKKGIKYLPLELLWTNALTRPDFIAYDFQEGGRLSVRICRKLFGCPTVAWTIKSQKELDSSKKYFDAFIFENFIPGN